ncbi:MAG: chorismate mutase, partial [Cyanobacteria bacterium M_surface_9_m1_291]|nr:chorismate mutase [Cyanobacteria bacterium M_surface_9_m1_291]
RLLAHAWLEAERDPQHPYLRQAAGLRPDRVSS